MVVNSWVISGFRSEQKSYVVSRLYSSTSLLSQLALRAEISDNSHPLYISCLTRWAEASVFLLYFVRRCFKAGSFLIMNHIREAWFFFSALPGCFSCLTRGR
jgi:hypothetical protein